MCSSAPHPRTGVSKVVAARFPTGRREGIKPSPPEGRRGGWRTRKARVCSPGTWSGMRAWRQARGTVPSSPLPPPVPKPWFCPWQPSGGP